MSEQELIDAGYHAYPPNRTHGDRWEIAYQKRFYAEKREGEDRRTRYFMDVRVWDHPKHDPNARTGYEAFLSVNNGCRFFPMETPMQIIFWSLNTWSVEQMETAAKEIHDRLETIDYERNPDEQY